MNDKRIPQKIQKVLKELKVNNPILLGKGGEGYIFTYTNDTAIKIYINTFNEANEDYLQSLEKLQTLITSKNLPFTTPQILERGNVDGIYYDIEKKLGGVLMEDKFPTLTDQDKFKLLKSYYEALKSLNGIELPDFPYGSILQTPPKRSTDTTWPGFLIKMLHYKIKVAGKHVVNDVIDFDNKVKLLTEIIENELSVNKKSLVHADYFVNQVLVNEQNEISAVLDISYHAVAGDKRLDAAGVFFFEGMKNYTKDHINFLHDLSVKDYGESILKYNDIYRMYYCFYFSEVHTFMPEWYQALLKNLNNEEIWKRISQF